jgi:hypothetical protein
MTTDQDDVLPQIPTSTPQSPEVAGGPPTTTHRQASFSRALVVAGRTSTAAEVSLPAKVTHPGPAEAGDAGLSFRFRFQDPLPHPPYSAAAAALPIPVHPPSDGMNGDDCLRCPGSDLELRVRAIEAVLSGESCPHCMAYESDAYEESGASETLPDEWPGLTEALHMMDIETVTQDQVLNRVEQIFARHRPASGRATGKKASKAGGVTLTVDERLKALHHIAPDFAVEKSLKEIAALFACSPSAFDGGDYYENTLKVKREEVRARKSMKRAGGPDRSRDENRQVVRDNRYHVESYEDVDDRIDATWDERRGGRFAN